MLLFFFFNFIWTKGKTEIASAAHYNGTCPVDR